MKNITHMLNNGNLTPRERYILLIQNDMARYKTGKEIFTPADKAALENWHAKNNEEAREWNQMNEGWKQTGKMEIEAEVIYKDAQVAYLSESSALIDMLHYPSHREMRRYIQNLKNVKKVSVPEALEIVEKQKQVKLRDGVDFDYAAHQLAFDNLPDEDRKQFANLYADIETDHRYLDQEEVIANLLGKKKSLSQEAKDKLATLVSEQSYNHYAKEYQLFHYFACIPILEIAKYFLKSKDIAIPPKEEEEDYDREYDRVTKTMEAYAEKHGTTIKAMLKWACLKWLDYDLLDEYTPLVLSNQSDLFDRWLLVKKEAKKILLDHVKKGELALRERTDTETRKQKLYSKGLYDSELENAKKVFEDADLEPIVKGEADERSAFETFNNMVITGESIYNFKGEYEFVKEFKEQADKYDPNLGIVYSNDDPEHGEHLDRELLICDYRKDGKPNFFSVHGLSLHILSGIMENQSLFEEVEKDGKIIIQFKDPSMYAGFKGRRQELIDGYASLLAFEAILKRLSKIYETDLTYHVEERLMQLLNFIDMHNQAILIATNAGSDDLKKTRHHLFRQKTVLHFEEDLLIDVSSIKPDDKNAKEYEEKLRDILGDF